MVEPEEEKPNPKLNAKVVKLVVFHIFLRYFQVTQVSHVIIVPNNL